jgi:predicted MFS family arabinose efflux permease
VSGADSGPPAGGRGATARRISSPAGFRQVFGIAEFRALWAAQLLSVAGDQLARVALTVLVYERTRSPLLAAVAYAASIAPLFAGGLLSGVADRWPRRAVMITCDLARVPLTGLMAVPGVPLAALIVLLSLVTGLGAPFGSARAALFPEILGEAYPLGTAITMTTYQLAQVLGFAAGGAVTGLAGPRVALAGDGVTFLGSAAFVWLGVRHRPAPPRAGGERARAVGDVAAGVRLVLGRREVRTPMLLGCISAFYNVPEGLSAPLARVSGGGPLAVGAILAAAALGSASGALLLTRLARPAVRRRLTAPLAITCCAVLIAVALRPGLPALLLILLISGLCDSYQVQANASFVAAVPPDRRGQAFGLAAGAIQLGQGGAMIVAGTAAQHASPTVVIAVAGAAGAVAAALVTLR